MDKNIKFIIYLIIINDIKGIIGYLHLILGIIKNTYGYIFSSILLYDSIYLIIFALIPLSWILFKGECLISYFVKIYENSNYKLGDNQFHHKDISDLFSNKTYYILFSNITTFIYIGSLIIVNNRTNIIPKYIFYIIILLLLFYIYDMDLYKSYYSNLFCPYFQIILTIGLLYIIFNCIKKNI